MRDAGAHLVLHAAVVPIHLHELVIAVVQRLQVLRHVLHLHARVNAVYEVREALQLAPERIVQMPVHEIDGRERLAARGLRRAAWNIRHPLHCGHGSSGDVQHAGNVWRAGWAL